MNQQEYVDGSDRVKVSNALQILDDIIPEQFSTISPSELMNVIAALRYWDKKLLKQFGKI